MRRGSRVHPPADKLSQTVRLANILTVDLTRVDESRVLVQLFSRSQPLLSRQRPREGDTVRSAGRNIEGGKVRIVSGHGDRPTLGMNSLGRITGSTVQDDVVDSFIDGGEGDVVIQELTVLHQHQGVAGVEMRHIRVYDNGDQAGRGKGLVTHGPESWPGNG